MSGRPSSLREYDNPADRIRQHRQASTSPLLIVEGPDDLLVLRPHLDPLVEIFPVDGKRNAAIVGTQLVEWAIGRFIVVVDHDFDGDDAARFASMPDVYY